MNSSAWGDFDDTSDADLVALVRAGDLGGTEGLWRRHYQASLAFAISLSDPALGPDLVSDAFEKVFSAIEKGGGPDHAFRPYLLTTVRRLYVDHVRKHARTVLTDDFAPLERQVPSERDVGDRVLDAGLVQQAFRTLPERSQAVLWYGAVEGSSHDDIGKVMGLKPNAVAALAFRAREALRQAYMSAYLGTSPQPDCAAAAPSLPRLVRGDLAESERASVEGHLSVCTNCRDALADLDQIRTNLSGVVFASVAGAVGHQVLGDYQAAGQSSGAVTGPTPAQAATKTLATWLTMAVAASVVVAGVVALVLAQGAPAPTTATGRPPSRAADEPTVPAPTSPTRRPASGPTAVPVIDGPTPTATPLPTGFTTPAALDLDPGPSATPTRTPSGSADPAPTRIRLGQPSQSPIEGSGEPWVHLDVPMSASSNDLTLALAVTGATQWFTHRDAGFGPWACVSSGSEVGPLRLTCTLPPGARRVELGLDLLVPQAASVNLTVAPAKGTRGMSAHLGFDVTPP
ncbi:sigma-70 family RNA polymerase sigma factor [Nocardioides sp.]|uniref:sigma-70 family RNA polymerase sigma factor n=1 Tax=Nocardioides sp. TaxID=35761 RepID=UPI003D0C8227